MPRGVGVAGAPWHVPDCCCETMVRMARTNSTSPSNRGATTRPWFSVPPRASALAGWALLPLRLFIGITFAFAGCQKLANPNFFDANSPSSIQAQLIASARTSPIHLLIGHLLRFATPLGIIISLAEIAIGLGMLLGVWTRLAALGGMVLSFSLFLTVSFHASPFYTGADIVWFFAFIPFVLAGAGGAPALDTLLMRRASQDVGHGDPTPTVVPFVVVQDLCGNFDKGRCNAQANAACGPDGCPALAGGRQSIATRRAFDDVDRRAVVLGAGAAVAAGAATLVLGGAAAGLGRAIGGAPKASSSTTNLTTTTTAPSTNSTSTTSSLGTPIGAASAVPVGGAATFTLTSGDPGIVLQPTKGSFVVYDAVCPHAGCTTAFSKAADLIVCPCHGSEFTVATGACVAGPSPRGLTKYTVSVGTDGQLYYKA